MVKWPSTGFQLVAHTPNTGSPAIALLAAPVNQPRSSPWRRTHQRQGIANVHHRGFPPKCGCPVGRANWPRPRPSGHADTAAGIDQQDRQAGAGGHALFDGFAGALVGRAPLGVVVHVDQIEELAIQGLSCFGGGGAVGHQWCAAFQEVGPPGFAAFIEDGIRQDIIEEAFSEISLAHPKVDRACTARSRFSMSSSAGNSWS